MNNNFYFCSPRGLHEIVFVCHALRERTSTSRTTLPPTKRMSRGIYIYLYILLTINNQSQKKKKLVRRLCRKWLFFFLTGTSDVSSRPPSRCTVRLSTIAKEKKRDGHGKEHRR